MPGADDFAEFYSAIHPGRGPFPWQEALATRVAEEGHWPAVIDVPTGLGKTSVLDVAVFAAALGGAAARRRIFYVVDRRLVVDESYEHAWSISDALDNPAADIVEWVAERLRPADNPGRALDVTRMRGGTTWERTWLERPDQHAIITGTIDQVGSRLLFRGYGVSEWARSIDAALVGTDSLIIVDEAHLAGPLLCTIEAALALDTTPIMPPPILIKMSATASAADADVHRITEADLRHPVAGARLRARKRVRLVEVQTRRSSASDDVSRAIALIAGGFAGTRVVGVVVNTVAMARQVFELLRSSHETVLLTGASRQVDRDYLLARYYDRISIDRTGTEQPLIVVATQTIEVGANIDLDVLVTETAPLSSLVQRLGRLNRTARWESEPAPAIVVHNSAVTAEDPVYGPARLDSFAWLSDRMVVERFGPHFNYLDFSESIDGSPEALRRLTTQMSDDERVMMQPRQRVIPVLFESTLDTWVRTSPAPVPDQPVAPFLHGIGTDDQPPVTVLWRAAPEPDLLLQVPPASEEGLEISITAARRWLRGHMATPDESDVTPYTQPASGGTDASDLRMTESVLRVRGRGERPQKIAPQDVRPGDVIVVPASFGGCDEFGWNPTSRTPAMDVADLAMRRGRPMLRLGPPLRAAIEWIDGWQEAKLTQFVDRFLSQALADVSAGQHQDSAYVAILREMASQSGVTPPLRQLLNSFRSVRVSLVTQVNDYDESTGPADGVDAYLGLMTTAVTPFMDDDTASGSSATRKRLGLDAHERAVARRAREFAENLRLPQRLIDTIEFAARWHDEGKRDPRFQAMLWAGDRLAAEIADEPLAKSGMDPADRAALHRAARLSGYPNGMRHEALSARIAAHRQADKDIDRELATHLVASHHGRARALLPPTPDSSPEKIDVPGHGVFESSETVDWTQPARFAALNRAYGRWGLALLESVVRLADIWCSARDEYREGES